MCKITKGKLLDPFVDHTMLTHQWSKLSTCWSKQLKKHYDKGE
jgi:hypothetical protein